VSSIGHRCPILDTHNAVEFVLRLTGDALRFRAFAALRDWPLEED